MGDPNTGEIYEGLLRNEGDVPLDREQAAWLRELPLNDRIAELKELQAQMRSGPTEMVDRPTDSLSDLRELLREQTTPMIVSESGTTREMPRYKSHKEVWALKIADLKRDSDEAAKTNRETDGSVTIYPKEEGYGPIKLNNAYLRKHNPQVGGYFVVYKDGYQSYSPAQPFEEGYTRI